MDRREEESWFMVGRKFLFLSRQQSGSNQTLFSSTLGCGHGYCSEEERVGEGDYDDGGDYGRKKQGFMLVEAPNEKKHVYDYIFDARWAAYLVATETPPDREELAEVKQDEYEEDFIIEIPGMFCVDSSSSLSYRMTREMGGTSGRSFRFSQRPVPPNATTRHG